MAELIPNDSAQDNSAALIEAFARPGAVIPAGFYYTRPFEMATVPINVSGVSAPWSNMRNRDPDESTTILPHPSWDGSGALVTIGADSEHERTGANRSLWGGQISHIRFLGSNNGKGIGLHIRQCRGFTLWKCACVGWQVGLDLRGAHERAMNNVSVYHAVVHSNDVGLRLAQDGQMKFNDAHLVQGGHYKQNGIGMLFLSGHTTAVRSVIVENNHKHGIRAEGADGWMYDSRFEENGRHHVRLTRRAEAFSHWGHTNCSFANDSAIYGDKGCTLFPTHKW